LKFEVSPVAAHTRCLLIYSFSRLLLVRAAGLVGIALLTLVVITATSSPSADQDPIYKGKPLSEWISRALGGKQKDEAEGVFAAIAEAGTNAVPALIHLLEATDSSVKRKVGESLDGQHYVRFHFVWAEERRDLALAGFEVLGLAGEPAVPKLKELLRNPETATDAAEALALIASPSAAAVLVGSLVDESDVQRKAARTSLQTHLDRRMAFQETHARHDYDRGDERLASSAVPMLLTLRKTDAASRAAELEPVLTLAEKLSEFLPETSEGGIIRGPIAKKQLALVFTGHEFADAALVILDELERHRAKGSFFLTGDFLRNTNYLSLLNRLVSERHYLGPHSDKHVLYCPWDGPKKTLVSPKQFDADLEGNLTAIQAFGVKRAAIQYFLPPFQWYNQEIVNWSSRKGLRLVNFTPGTRSNADYTGEADKNFVSSKAIFDSILAREQQDPHGLNGFLLLLHIGSGPGRADKFYPRFGELLDYLVAKGYALVRVDELLD
jgi:peptidoglycan/xylan/chitin deacetylase (PgdA/CDA1 family)